MNGNAHFFSDIRLQPHVNVSENRQRTGQRLFRDRCIRSYSSMRSARLKDFDTVH